MMLNHNEYLNYTLPNNWCAEEDIDNLLLYNPSGNGAITTSFFNVLKTKESANPIPAEVKPAYWPKDLLIKII